jgi:hypothetical protein
MCGRVDDEDPRVARHGLGLDCSHTFYGPGRRIQAAPISNALVVVHDAHRPRRARRPAGHECVSSWCHHAERQQLREALPVHEETFYRTRPSGPASLRLPSAIGSTLLAPPVVVILPTKRCSWLKLEESVLGSVVESTTVC